MLGGGHAQIFVLRALARERPSGVECTLLPAYPRPAYSGMLPGFLRGTYREDEITYDLEALARAAGARFVETAATSIDADARTVETPAGRFGFDVLSVNVGSVPAGLDTPGVRE